MALLCSYDVTSYQMCISLTSFPVSQSHSGYEGLGLLLPDSWMGKESMFTEQESAEIKE